MCNHNLENFRLMK
jgi:hypothetical protein